MSSKNWLQIRSLKYGGGTHEAPSAPAIAARAGVPGVALNWNVLFICSQNRLRSPTAEQVFAAWPCIETSSAGLASAGNPVTPEVLAWADVIFVMERSHRAKLSARFKPHLGGKRVICLDIPDNFAFMDPALIRLLEVKVTPHLPRVQPVA